MAPRRVPTASHRSGSHTTESHQGHFCGANYDVRPLCRAHQGETRLECMLSYTGEIPHSQLRPKCVRFGGKTRDKLRARVSLCPYVREPEPRDEFLSTHNLLRCAHSSFIFYLFSFVYFDCSQTSRTTHFSGIINNNIEVFLIVPAAFQRQCVISARPHLYLPWPRRSQTSQH